MPKAKQAKPSKKTAAPPGDAPGDSPQILLKTFLTAMRERDQEVAKLCFSKAFTEETEFTIPDMSEGPPFEYTLKEPEPIEGGVVIEAHFDPPMPATPPIMKFVLVQEDGWKIDMPKTFERTFGADPDQLMDQLVSSVGDAMKQVGDAMADGIGKAFGAAGLAGPNGSGIPAQEDEGPYADEFTQRFAEAMREINEKLAVISENLHQSADVEVAIRMTWRSFLEGRNDEDARQMVHGIDSILLRNLDYVLGEVNRKVPLANRMKRLRLVHVESPSQRVIYADGSTVIYRMHRLADGGCYGVEESIQILSGVMAGIPEYRGDEAPISPEPPPDASAWGILDDYRSRFADPLEERLRSEIKSDIRVHVDWYSLQSQSNIDADSMRNLYPWGLHRIVGGFALLARDEAAAAILKQDARGFILKFVEHPEERSIRCSYGDLDLSICVAAGEAGCFYEHQIAHALEVGLEIKLRPLVDGITNYFWSRVCWIAELGEPPLDFQWNKPGFTSHADPDRNLFALTLLKEHGIDALCLAIRALCEENPNFRQQFFRRVRMLIIDHAPSPDRKGLRGHTSLDATGQPLDKVPQDQASTITYSCYLHEGYDGYLTIQQIKKLLPGIVASMPDLPPPPPAVTDSTEDQPPPLVEAEGQEDAAPQPTPEDQNRQMFDEVVASLKPTMSNFKATFVAMVGKPLELDMDWDSLRPDLNGPGMLLNACLTGLFSGLTQLSTDPSVVQAIHKQVDRVVLSRAASRSQVRILLEDRALIISAMTDPSEPPLDPAIAAETIRKLLKPAGQPKPARKSPPPKTAAAPQKPPKSKAKAAAKPTPAGKKRK